MGCADEDVGRHEIDEFSSPKVDASTFWVGSTFHDILLRRHRNTWLQHLGIRPSLLRLHAATPRIIHRIRHVF